MYQAVGVCTVWMCLLLVAFLLGWVKRLGGRLRLRLPAPVVVASSLASLVLSSSKSLEPPPQKTVHTQ